MDESDSALQCVLITGGCGCVGRHLVERLRRSEPTCRIHVLDVNTERNRVPSVTYHTCDISSLDAVTSVMGEVRPRVVFHTASPSSQVNLPKLFERVNVFGTRNLLSSAAGTGTVRALVYTSTSAVVHDSVSDLLDADETLPVLWPPVQKRAYTLTKAIAEADVLAANRKGNETPMLTVSLRPATIFGEYDTVCLGKMVAAARQGKMRFQIGRGENLYDFVYVGNLADAHILAAQALLKAYGRPPLSADTRIDGEAFNITNEEPVLFWEFSRKVAAAAGHPVQRESVLVIPTFLGIVLAWISGIIVWLVTQGRQQADVTAEGVRMSTIHRTVNGAKARRLLKYRPMVSVDDGIKRGVDSLLGK